MISPSRWRSMRNTPWVDGCCGPKCSSIRSASGSYCSMGRWGSTSAPEACGPVAGDDVDQLPVAALHEPARQLHVTLARHHGRTIGGERLDAEVIAQQRREVTGLLGGGRLDDRILVADGLVRLGRPA